MWESSREEEERKQNNVRKRRIEERVTREKESKGERMGAIGRDEVWERERLGGI